MLQIKQKNAGSRSEWLVENRYTFGTGIENNYKVSGANVNSVQAGLEVNGDNVALFNLGGGDSVCHNGDVLEKNVVLKPGDEFSVGDAVYIIEDPKQNRREQHQEPRSWSLRAQNTALANKTYVLSGTQIIGRSNECDICLNVVHLSRRHARLTVEEDTIQIDDLESSNGTFVNGQRIESAQVKAGDEIAFDTLRFILMGPQTNSEKTQIRVAADSDATTMRPAMTNAEAKQKYAAAAKKPSPNSNDNAQVKAAPVQTEKKEASNPAQEETSGSTKAMMILIGLLIIAVAGYVLLG